MRLTREITIMFSVVFFCLFPPLTFFFFLVSLLILFVFPLAIVFGSFFLFCLCVGVCVSFSPFSLLLFFSVFELGRKSTCIHNQAYVHIMSYIRQRKYHSVDFFLSAKIWFYLSRLSWLFFLPCFFRFLPSFLQFIS